MGWDFTKEVGKGETFLELAAEFGQLEIVKYIYEWADRCPETDREKTLLSYWICAVVLASKNGHNDVVKEVLSHVPDGEERTEFEQAFLKE